MHVIPHVGLADVIGAIVVALVFVGVVSLVPEPARQRFNAIFVAGAGTTYFGGGLGLWELVLPVVITALAYRGLASYRFVGLAWLAHAGWDVLQHFYAQPILAFAPTSSAGCAICDPLLALWFFAGAPSVWRRSQTSRSGSTPSLPS
jgi:hypothetical protein